MSRLPVSQALSSLTLRSTRLNFADPAFLARSLSRPKLLRSLAILQACANPRLVAASPALLSWSRRLLGGRLWRALLRPTLYEQFVGGDSAEELEASVGYLREAGVLPMIMVSIEDEDRPEANAEVLRKCVIHSDTLTPEGRRPQMQVKVTALLPGSVLRQLSQAWLQETDGCPNTVPRRLVEQLAWALDSEGEEICSSLTMPTRDLTQRLKTGLRLLRSVFEEAESRGVTLLVDAEYEDVNCGLAAFTYAAALRYNSISPLVWNTFQCYLRRTPEAFEAAVKFHRDAGVAFGAKVVRGAYMAHENALAKREGRESPVHGSYQDTSRTYNAVIQRLIDLAASAGGKSVQGIVASHNEDSVKKAAERLEELGLANDDAIVFGQVYGMADYLSYPLSGAGFHVYKSVPFGSIEETLPYLCRRAQENQSVLQGTRKERNILMQALAMK